jgi:hypothetical protein
VASRLHPTPRKVSLIISLALTVGLWAPFTNDAGAQTKTFRPVLRGRNVLVFRPHGVNPGTVMQASVKLRRRGRVVVRRLRVGRVRHALKKGHRIRIHKPSQVQAGSLVILSNPGSCGFGTFSSVNLPGACWRPYSDSSPFNTALAASPQLVANSSAITSRVVGFGPPGKHASGTADTADDWSHPIYFSRPTDPTYTVRCTDPWCNVDGMRVQIPAQARPAGGGDGHLAVIDQQSGWEYDFWQVQQKPAAGGILVVTSGGRTRVDGDGRGAGATASGFGLAAGTIRPAELAAGQIDHALFMAVKCTNGTSVWPADPNNHGRSCSEIGLPDANAPAMGQHFFLDMSDAQIDALNEPPWEKTILRAMARYGMFVGDTGGDAWGIQFESGSSYTSFGYQDPWEQLGQQFRVPTWNAAGGRRRYIFDFQQAVDWGAKLKVAAPA